MSFLNNFSTNKSKTPINSTPSIVQQRFILIAFALVISAVVWWQHAGHNPDYPVQKFSQTPVPEMVAELDFGSAEASWNGLQIDPQGNLTIDALTQSALADAVALLDDESSESRMTRIALLLEKQFGAATSKQIMELLPVLKDYQDLEQRWMAEHGHKSPPPFEELFQLQDELLGEGLAETLFSKQRRLAKMMVASQQIQNDSSLTDAEKQQALMELQAKFQQRFEESAPNE